MMLEVIATTLEDSLNAEAGGADRIELVAALHEGGLTPSMALVESVTSAVKIPVHVMIRPHSRTFHMLEDDIRIMIRDIKNAHQTGAAALVFGVLTPQKTIEMTTLEMLLDASPLPVTFHRAFDEIPNQVEALGSLLGFKQIRSILTSGGAESALHGVEQIRKLVSITQGHDLQIMAGGGLTVDGVKSFVHATDVPWVHFGTGVRTNLKAEEPVDVDKVRQLKRQLSLC